MMHAQSPSAAATARKSHASRTARAHQFWAFAWSVRNVRFASRCLRAAWVLRECCLGAARALLGCCLGAAW
eukprot:11188193-Lingulodinium_polyedra.AAC.1